MSISKKSLIDIGTQLILVGGISYLPATMFSAIATSSCAAGQDSCELTSVGFIIGFCFMVMAIISGVVLPAFQSGLNGLLGRRPTDFEEQQKIKRRFWTYANCISAWILFLAILEFGRLVPT